MSKIVDPFLRFWCTFVEPNRSRLAAGRITQVRREIAAAWPRFLGAAWEEIARASVPHLRIDGVAWMPAHRWWGPDSHGEMLELDIVARSVKNPDRILVGEAKLAASAADVAGVAAKALRCPELQGKRLTGAVWILRGGRRGENVFGAAEVADVLR